MTQKEGTDNEHR